VDWFRSSVEGATRGGFVVLARILLDLGLSPRPQLDYGIASFARQESGKRPFPPLPPLGTCTTLTSRLNLRALLGQARSPAEWTSIPEHDPGSRRLDAGPSIAIAGPSGARTLARDARRQEYYSAIIGGAPPFSHTVPLPDYLNHGRYSITAPGGSEVGGFTATLDVPRALIWKNRGAIDKVDRSRGVTVEWSAARHDSAVAIIAADADRYSGDSAMCLCLAPASDGHFRVPPLALSNLPPSSVENEISASYLMLLEMPADPPVKLNAEGLDTAFAAYVSASAKVVRYQ
jgi:hypothetical protein